MSTTSELMSTTSQLMEQPTMTVLELAKVLGVSKDAGYKFVREGGVRTLRVGKRIVIPTAAVREVLGEVPSK